MVKRWILRRSTASIAISEAIRRSSCEGSLVIGNPYRSELFKCFPGLDRQRDFVFVGRMVSDKGVDLLLHAFAVLVSNRNILREAQAQAIGEQLTLTLIGDGPEILSLHRLVNQLGISMNVSFVGTLKGENLAHCLNQHRVLVVPSRWDEPFGNVALEGAACGCIVVGSDGGGLPDAIGDGGILFISGSLEDLVSKLQMALTLSDHERFCMRSRSKTHLQRHTEQHVAAQYLAVLKEAVSVYPGKVSSHFLIDEGQSLPC
nr:glycosyltransferase family 4 protein [Synechococcus sp. CCY 0621]